MFYIIPVLCIEVWRGFQQIESVSMAKASWRNGLGGQPCSAALDSGMGLEQNLLVIIDALRENFFNVVYK